MQQVQIITERLASLSYRFAKENGIYIFPVDIVLNNKVIKDDNDKSATEFLRMLTTTENIPTTAVPPLKEMMNEFLKATRTLNNAIYISASSKLSGIFNAGQKVAERLKNNGKLIKVFDSSTVVSMEGMYAYWANKLAKEGKDIDEILNELIHIRDNRRIVEYGVLETLKYLEKGGRIGKAKAWLANLFSFKPIITAKDGVLEPIAKVRTDNQGLEKVLELIKEDIKRIKPKEIEIMYDYGISDKYVREIVNPSIQKEFCVRVISFNQISTTIACHMGPELWGIALHYIG